MVAVAAEEAGNVIGGIRLCHIRDRSAAILEAYFLDAVEPCSSVRTDGWASHSQLHSIGYRHFKAVTEGDPERLDRDAPRVHRVASPLKRWLLGTHQGTVEKAP